MLKRIILVILVFTSSGLSFATTWKKTAPFSQYISQLVADRKHPQLVFAVADHGDRALWRSTDFGHHWIKTNVQGTGSIAIHPVTSKIYGIFSASSEPFAPSLWISTDTGKTFTRQIEYEPLSDLVPGNVILNPAETEKIYAFKRDAGTDAKGVLLFSADDGYHWRPFRTPPEFSLDQMLFSPFHSNTIYLSAFHGSSLVHGPPVLLASHDGGHRWALIQKSHASDTAFLFQSDPLFRRAFVTNQNKIELLTCAGWKRISTQKHLFNIVSVPRHAELLFGLQFTEDFDHVNLLKSIDRGRTWNPVPDNLDGTIRMILALDDPTNSILAVADNFRTLYRRPLNTF